MLESEKLLVICPGCNKRLRVKLELAGKRVRCPNKACGQLVTVPVPSEEEETETADGAAGGNQVWVWSGVGTAVAATAAFCVWFFLLRDSTPAPMTVNGAGPDASQNGQVATTPAVDPGDKGSIDISGGNTKGNPQALTPKAGQWEGEFVSGGIAHKLRLWISADGKTVEKGQCVARLHGGATISSAPVLLSPAPIEASKFKADYVDNSYYFRGTFTSATQAAGEASLSFIVGATGVVRLTGTWTAQHKAIVDAAAPAVAKSSPEVAKQPTAKDKLLGAWRGKLGNGTVELEFRTDIAIVTFRLGDGTFGVGRVAYEFDATSGTGKVDKASTKLTGEGALLVTGEFQVADTTFKVPETRLERVPMTATASKSKEPAPPAKNSSESKAWSVKLMKASRGFIEGWAYLDVEFKALTPEQGDVSERLLPYKNSFLDKGLPTEPYLFMMDLGSIADYTRKIGGAPAPEKVLAKPSRVFFSGAVELELPGGKRLRPYLTSMPTGLLEFTPKNSETKFGFASTRAVGGADPAVVRYIVERGGSTLAVVQPGRTITSKLSYDNVPKDTRSAKLHFADCPPIEVSID